MTQSEALFFPHPASTITYKSKLYISLMAWTLAISLFHFGYFLMYVTQISTPTLNELYSIDLDSGLTEGILNGCIPIGALFGALSSSFFIPRLSRRQNMLMANAICFTAGCLIFIRNFPMLITGRLVQGFCVGLYTSFVPLIIRQLSPTNLSGTLGSYTELNICIGVTIGCFFPYALLKISGDQSGRDYWFLIFGLPQAVIILQTLLLFFVFPYETPKYLLSIGKEEEARTLIQMIYKAQCVEDILQEKKLDLKSLEIEQSMKKSINEESQPFSFHLSIPKAMSLHLSSLQQISGINIVAIYAVSISQDVTSGQLSLIMPTMINLLELIATAMSFLVLNRFGRRSIIVNGTIIIGVANLILTIGFSIKGTSSFSLPIILFGIVLIIVSFGLTLGPTVWLYIPEIVEPEIIPYSTSASWISVSFVVILFPILTQDYLNNDPTFLFVFSTVWCFGASFINYFLVLETKGKAERDVRQEYKRMSLCRREMNQL